MTQLLLLGGTHSDGQVLSHRPLPTPMKIHLSTLSDNNIQCEWNKKGRENVD